MIYRRHYLQFNDFVFDEFDMIAEDDSSATFKTFSEEYGFTHGAYSPFKQKGGLLRPSSASMTITLKMKKIPCEYRQFYRDFAVTQLTTQGKLWAVQNNTLVWAYAYITNLRESSKVRKDRVEFDVDFALPEGVWHKADKQRTFLVPHDVCSFMDCYNYKEVRPCWGTNGDCCHCGDKTSKESCNCCECDSVDKEDALCYREESAGCCTNGLQFFYDCDNPYRIVYNCAAGEKYFGGYYGEDHLGEKICGDCGNVAGLFYSNTEIPTNGVNITIHGNVTNPMIEINGNLNIIKGEFNGTLKINSDGSVYYSKDDCMECDPLDVDAWVIPDGMDYGWTVNPGNNRFILSGACCGMVCAYIETDALAL